MILWCRSCFTPISYRNWKGFRFEWFRSGENVTCTRCSLRILEEKRLSGL